MTDTWSRLRARHSTKSADKASRRTLLRVRPARTAGVVAALLAVAGAGSWAVVVTTSGPNGTAQQPTSGVSETLSSAPEIAVPGGAAPGIAGFNDVWCTAASACVAVGASAQGAGTAAESGDGGVQWAAVTLPAGTKALGAVECDGATCLAVGAGVVLRSTTGGRSWAAVTDPAPLADLLGVSCASAADCVAVGVVSDPIRGTSGAAIRSTDGGVTWTSVSLAGYEDQALDTVFCPSATACIAGGDVIDVSHDGGATWQAATVTGGLQVVRSVSCPTSGRCVAVGPNAQAAHGPSAQPTAVVSSDGGATWNPVPVPAGSGALDTVSCPTATSCTASGGSATDGTATSLVSSNGGATWTAAPAPALSGVAALSCPPTSTGCVEAGRGSAAADPAVSLVGPGAPSSAGNTANVALSKVG